MRACTPAERDERGERVRGIRCTEQPAPACSEEDFTTQLLTTARSACPRGHSDIITDANDSAQCNLFPALRDLRAPSSFMKTVFYDGLVLQSCHRWSACCTATVACRVRHVGPCHQIHHHVVWDPVTRFITMTRMHSDEVLALLSGCCILLRDCGLF
ncbi:hypothetical protein BaRGS_00009861 [Batillaria attramentaria]|uniref:Uncharacterized protein n=1 Tax=Batillaria attramentaria TaxID=370345 RepID=A0ABD0LGZ7_9CAEN